MSANLPYILANGPRFWQQVDIPGETCCWTYRGTIDRTGYGRYANFLAHRFAWMAFHGEVLAGDVVIRHRCDNPPCVNPAHLIPGTQAENMQDAVERTWGPACKNGHPRTPETTAITKSGHRRCITCDREHQRARRARAKEAARVQ